MLVDIKAILMGRAEFADLPKDQQDNAMDLMYKVNKFFEGFTWPLAKIVNDGYRRPQDKPKNGAAASMHYSAAAIDLDDDDAGTIWKYVYQNRARLKEIGLWMEHPCWTHCDGMSWLHFQIYAPRSGNRFYVPSTRPNPNPKFWDGKYESNLNGK